MNNWYFSTRQGLNFNSGSPQAIPGIPSSIGFGDNVAVCSDRNGTLNFIYSSGTPGKVYDRNYNPMPGPAFSTNVFNSKLMWAKYPGSSTKYFLFYPVASPVAGGFYLKYGIIDMSLNAGLGQITVSEGIVDSSLSIAYCLINKPGSDEFWIIGNKNRTDNFYSRLVTASGISDQRVTSIAGLNPIKSEYNFVAMKAAPNGQMFAGGIFTDYSNIFLNLKSNIEVFNFDRQSGAVTNKVMSTRTVAQVRHLEFSPDSRLLYSSDNYLLYNLQPCGLSSSVISQYNLCYTDSVSFSKYAVTLGNRLVTCSYPAWGNLQTGPDKQLYTRYTGNVLSTIQYPNKIGTSANLIFNAYPLSTAASNQLPVFNQAVTELSAKNNILYSGGCYPAPVAFSISNDTISYASWNFGDPASGAQNISTSLAPSHSFSSPGFYSVTVSLYNSNNMLIETLSEAIELKDPSKKLLYGFPPDSTICTGSNININLSVNNGIFEWSKRETGSPVTYSLGIFNDLTINSPGTWFVKMIQNGCTGCELIDSITVKVVDGPFVNLGPDKLLCNSETITLAVADVSNNINCLWSTGETTDQISVNSPGTYWVKAEMGTGCFRFDTINIFQNPVNNFSLPADTLLCTGQTLELSAAIPGAQYQWQDNSTAPSFTVTSEGWYWARVTFQGCTKTDSIYVRYVTGLDVNLGADSSLCVGNGLTLSSNVTADAYLWSTGAITSSIPVSISGDYWLKVQHSSGCWAADTIKVTFSPVPTFSFGIDTILCENKSLLLNAPFTQATYLWQDFSTAATYTVSSAGLYWLKITKDGCAFSDTIMVNYKPGPVINLGRDSSICSGIPLVLSAAHPNSVSWLWQDGSTDPTYTVIAPGLYYAEATASNGCKRSDSISISEIPFPSFNLGIDTGICSGKNLLLKTNLTGLPHLWNNGSSATAITVTNPGLYWVEVDNNGCKKRDSIRISVKPSPFVSLGADTVLCNNETLVLNAANANASYRWQDGSISPAFTVRATGLYYAIVNKDGCLASDSIYVSYNQKPVFSLGPDKLICNDAPILLSPGIAASSYLWQDGSISSTYLTQQAGTYTVQVYNECGFASDTIKIEKGSCDLFVPNSFTPDENGINDIFRASLKVPTASFSLQVFNRYGKLLFETHDKSKGWDGKFNGLEQMAGNYIWVIKYTLALSPFVNNATGNILLIR